MCESVWDLRDLSLVALESVDTVECSCVEHTGSSCRESGVPRCNEISEYLMDAGHLILPHTDTHSCRQHTFLEGEWSETAVFTSECNSVTA